MCRSTKGESVSETAKKSWELFIRAVGIVVAICGPLVGYQIAMLNDADRESMTDRNQMRERLAVVESISAEARLQRSDIKAALARIEDKLDMHMNRQPN